MTPSGDGSKTPLGKIIEGKLGEQEHVTLHLTCKKCGKEFTFSYSYPKGDMEPCMQGLIPQRCPSCRKH
ncbi:hypothetical protein GF342_04525 [Candidatus Woesearchaeota archaeon]|nr:hypothetical protein [Candidatus Woesearchaeota archaeon]